MSGTDHRDNTRVPVALRIKLRFRNVDTFISKFATNISTTGMFISSRKPREAGTHLRFELRLADDSTVIAGKGRVVWVRDYDPERPKDPHGMGIEFVSLSRGSRELIEKIVSARIGQGLGAAEDIPHSRKPSRPAPAGTVATPSEPLAAPSEKVSAPSKAQPAATKNNSETAQGLAGSKKAVVPAPKTRAPNPVLNQSPARGQSSGVVELSLDDLDSSQVDLGAVLRRARELVGKGNPDRELDELFRVSAAPIAETVDDASHRLAQMLGGRAVHTRRTRPADPPTDHAALADLAQDAPTPGPPSQEALDTGESEALDAALYTLDTGESEALDAALHAALDTGESEALDAALRTALDTGESAALDGAESTAASTSVDLAASAAGALTVIEDSVDIELPATDEVPALAEALETIEDEAGDFGNSDHERPTMVGAGISAALALDDALAALGETTDPAAQTIEEGLDSTLASLDLEDSGDTRAPRAETDESPDVISDEPIDESVDLTMFEDEDATDYERRYSVTSVPNGIDVGVLDPGGLEDNGIYELSKPGSGPIDLLRLADLPATRRRDDEEEFDAEVELDLPD